MSLFRVVEVLERVVMFSFLPFTITLTLVIATCGGSSGELSVLFLLEETFLEKLDFKAEIFYLNNLIGFGLKLR